MKFRLLPACFLLFATLSSAQVTQPTETFPFNITLLKPDSTAVNSKTVLKTGKPTVIAFWLTTCVPCHIELASYSSHFTEWQKQTDFQLVAISIDFQERFSKVKQMAKEKKWPFPVYWDKDRAFKNILPGNLNGLPQVFLFDKNGKLVWQHKKYTPGDEEELFAQVKALR